MREDMFKVIVERPRRRWSNAYKGDARPFRNSEERPARIGMRSGYSDRKYFNENLKPLQRYLGSQAGRPWSKVYGEIRATIDARSTVKHHVLQHLEDFVALHARLTDGRVEVMERWGTPLWVALDASRCHFYVHPVSGILLQNRVRRAYVNVRAAEQAAAQQARERVRRILSATCQLHWLDGCWYEVTLAPLPGRDHPGDWQCWDAVRKNLVRAGGSGHQLGLYGDAWVYAVSKRQLGARECRRLGLDAVSTAAKGPQGPFFMLAYPYVWRNAACCIATGRSTVAERTRLMPIQTGDLT